MIHLNAQRFTQSQQATAITAGITLIFFLGILSSLALALGALWLLAECFLLVMQVVIECLNTVGTLYSQSDPMIKLILLVTVGYVIYRAARYHLRKRGNQ